MGGIEEDYEEQLDVVKVNVNFEEELAQQYQVMASPTLVFFKEGQEVHRIRGLVKRPELEEKNKIKIAKMVDIFPCEVYNIINIFV